MRKIEAQQAILREWNIWQPANITQDQKTTGHEGFLFFLSIKSDISVKIPYQWNGDPWQEIKVWLMKAREISD